MKDKEFYVKLGIAVRMPIAFKKLCDKTYELKQLVSEDNYETEEERKINTTFEIYNNQNVKVATFHPSGKYVCLENSFQSIFDAIVDELNYGAYKAAKAQDDIHEKMTKEFETKFKAEKL